MYTKNTSLTLFLRVGRGVLQRFKSAGVHKTQHLYMPKILLKQVLECIAVHPQISMHVGHTPPATIWRGEAIKRI